MYIDRLHLENIRTFVGGKAMFFLHPDRDYTQPLGIKKSERDSKVPTPRLPNVNLLLGDNGSGKSTVLRTIAAAAFGPVAKDLLRDGSMVRHGRDFGVIQAALRFHAQDLAPNGREEVELCLEKRGERLSIVDGWEFDPADNTFGITSKPRTTTAILTAPELDDYAQHRKDHLKLWKPVNESQNDAFFIVGYGATRRVEQLDRYDSGARSKSRATRDQRVMSLFEDSYSLIPLASWLPRLKNEKRGRYTQVVHLIDKLLKPGQYTFSGKQDKNGDYLFLRGEMPVPFQSLSDGYRAFVGWVADLLFHVCFGCPSGHKLVDSCGIVLVDEVDLHLHPKWQMQVISAVAKALPKMQFVFTSHSPLVAGSLEWMNIITLKVTESSNRTVASRLKQSIHGLDADQILLTDFFGLKSTRSKSGRNRIDDLAQRAGLGDKQAAHEVILAMSRGSEVES